MRSTPLLSFPAPDPRIELRLKLECLQETGSFKVRGAWNQVCQLSEEERARGVVATSSGNHGRALAWAAQRAGVQATVVMPADAYPNKIAACQELGAEVVLCPTRAEAEETCRGLVDGGAVYVPPYDHLRTLEGAGTVGVEIAEQWPQVEVVLFPVGGGGLVAGSSLALQRALESVRIFGVEPAGAPSMSLALEAGVPVPLERITTQVQGLCPPAAGELNLAICLETLAGMFTLPDEAIFAAQARLVREGGWIVEPAGAAAPALVLSGALPEELLRNRTESSPLRIVAVVSGGNPDPAQLEAVRGLGL